MPRRRIKKANIKFISLVPKGANQLQPVYKSDGSFKFDALHKFDDDKGELTSVVYAPNLRDSQGDIADADVVKQMAYDYVSNGAHIDIRHDEKPLSKEKARIAESFIVQKTDERFHGWQDYNGNDVELEGAWATVIKIDDPDLRKKYRDGEWAGVSMGGTAVVEQEKADSIESDDVLAALAKALKLPPKTKTEPTHSDMDETKLIKAISDGITTLGTQLSSTLTEGITKAMDAALEKRFGKDEGDRKTEKSEFKAPPFYGSFDDEEALIKHARRTQLAKAQHDCDMTDATSVLEFRQKVRAMKAGWEAEDEAEGRDFIDPSAKKVTKKTAAQKAKGADGKSAGAPRERIQDGLEMANLINKMNDEDAAELVLDNEED